MRRCYASPGEGFYGLTLRTWSSPAPNACLLVTPFTLRAREILRFHPPQVRRWGTVIHPHLLSETQSMRTASPLRFQGALLIPPVTVLSTCRAIFHPLAPSCPGISPEALASVLHSPGKACSKASQSSSQRCHHLPTVSRTRSLKLRFLFLVLCSHLLPRAPRIAPLV